MLCKRFNETLSERNGVMKSKVSLNDVARHAGVSIGTASRVLNGNPKVSESACHAVQTAILELGYQPDSAARSMRKTKSRK